MGKLRLILVLFALCLARPSGAAEFFVSPTGRNTGNGSIDGPWDLQTALRQPHSVKPGDTIWLRGGTYTGHFVSTLRGEERKPIVVRTYAGERVTIDGNDGTTSPTLLVRGSDAWFWGFEFTNSNPTRISANTSDVLGRGEAVNLLGDRTRLINLIIHDTSQGVLTTTDIANTEITGCLIYYNGYDGPDRGHGHGIYIQNAAPSSKKVLDNIIFDQFGIGIHAYTESGQLDNLEFEGNTSFDNGALSQITGLTTNILVGANGSPASNATSSAKVAKKTVVRGNATYFSRPGGTAANLGYSKGISSPVILDNFFGGQTALVNAFRPLTMNGNTFYGAISGFSTSEFPNNTFLSARPTGINVYVRPNRYEYGRAHVTIYNWDRAPAVDVSLQGVLTPGVHYELRNAQDYFGRPVLAGVYTGQPLHVPMAALAPATPVGRPTPAPTGPDFQVFVLVPTSSIETPRNRPTRPAGPAFAAPVVRPVSPRNAVRAAASRAGEEGGTALSSPVSVEPCPHSFVVQAADPGPPSELSATRYLFDATLSTSRPACRTALVLGNRGAEVATVTLTFLAADRDNTSAPSSVLVLVPGENLRFGDALHDLFGLDDARGMLEIATDAPDRVTVDVERPFGPLPGTTVPAPISRRTTLHSPDSESTGTYDVLVLNPGPAETTIALTLAGSPNSAPETIFTVVPPHGFLRRAVERLFPSAVSRMDEPLSVDVDAGPDAVIALSLATAAGSPRTAQEYPPEP